MSQVEEKLHCINAQKVYDWSIQPLETELEHTIPRKHRSFKDQVNGNIRISCGEQALVWEASSDLDISGTVTVTHLSGCEEMEVFVDGEHVFTLTVGQSRSMTFSEIHSVEVRCLSGTDYCLGKYCLQLHYELSPEPNRECTYECYFSDEDGHPINIQELSCEEVLFNDQEDVSVALTHQQNVQLQKVIIKKNGFVTIVMICPNEERILCTVPFEVEEVLYLCAPDGTESKCSVIEAYCKMNRLELDQAERFIIKLFLCQEIKVTRDVTIEIIGSRCSPRVKQLN
ncbi:DUF3992 domain-containing protein [Halalkalibacter sp. AB-rgal2]|uniref:DUF3992 domain-containing protein n=1 Tax=Halalkalibacter sp. AB-rgal2 TaxID=3242695 RepID=UPI00359DF5F4